MADYQRMYTELFNAVTDAIALLQQAQRAAEETYMSGGEPVAVIAEFRKKGGKNSVSE